MSKAGKRVKSGGGQGGPAKWEAALLAAPFEDVSAFICKLVRDKIVENS